MARQWYNKRWNDKPAYDVTLVDCGNPQCSRKDLALGTYVSSYGVPAGTEEERVHLVANRRLRDVTICCTCGHYTSFC